MNRALRSAPDRPATDHETVQQQLDCCAEPLALAQEAAGVGFFECDLASGRLLCTDAWARLFGITPDESDLTWESWLRRLDPRDATRVQQAIHATLRRTSEHYRAEIRVKLAADGERWIDLRASLLYREGRPTRTIGAAIDITAQKRAQRARERLLDRQRRKCTQAQTEVRMRDELFAIVAHELRGPVNATLTWTRLLQRQALHGAALAQALNAIHTGSQAQARLAEDLLDASQMMQGCLKLERRTVDVASVVRSAVDVALPAVQASSLELTLVIDPAAGSLHADAQRLRQVLWNLMSNAVKFTSPGGGIQVHVAPVSGQIEIRISDTGRGIARDALPGLFDGGRRSETPLSRDGGGMGLGLAIARRIVHEHGGTIAAHSAGPGAGSTFVVRLPSAAVVSECATPPGPGL